MATYEGKWDCLDCGNPNRGLDKNCHTCGAARGRNVKFYLPQNAKVVSDKYALLPNEPRSCLEEVSFPVPVPRHYRYDQRSTSVVDFFSDAFQNYLLFSTEHLIENLPFPGFRNHPRVTKVCLVFFCPILFGALLYKLENLLVRRGSR